MSSIPPSLGWMVPFYHMVYPPLKPWVHLKNTTLNFCFFKWWDYNTNLKLGFLHSGLLHLGKVQGAKYLPLVSDVGDPESIDAVGSRRATS
jgi:hypothetical protein